MVKNSNIKHKRGFTIIEVVLVLAIAGLIFLMVFIALPALQRSQRNTQRRDDYSMLVTAINNYMASNNGKLSNLIKSGAATSLDPARWINTTGQDPSGNLYELIAYEDVGTGGAKYDIKKMPSGTALKDHGSCEGQTAETAAACTSKGGTWNGLVSGGPTSQVFIIIKANCQGHDDNGDPQPQSDGAPRSFAVYGYLEGGSVFCQDSGSIGK